MTLHRELPVAHQGGRVEFFQVGLEAHQHGATIYIVGLLAELAASRTEAVIAGIPVETSIIRVDLRGVQLIDPKSFVRVARSLNHWRDARRGRVSIEFPERSARVSSARPQLVRSSPNRILRQESLLGVATSSAIR